jgi:hypothetical protein
MIDLRHAALPVAPGAALHLPCIAHSGAGMSQEIIGCIGHRYQRAMLAAVRRGSGQIDAFGACFGRGIIRGRT